MENFDTKTEDQAGGDQDIEEAEIFMYQKYLDWLVVEQNALRSLDHIFQRREPSFFVTESHQLLANEQGPKKRRSYHEVSDSQMQEESTTIFDKEQGPKSANS
jgi:hypothetical protein